MVRQQYQDPLVPQPPDPEQLHPITPLFQEGGAQPAGQWKGHCVELPGQGRGWVQEVFCMHNTMVYGGVRYAWRVTVFVTVEGYRQASPNRQNRASLWSYRRRGKAHSPWDMLVNMTSFFQVFFLQSCLLAWY